MFIELTDHLRCPADHDESFLVLLPDTMEGRSVHSGQLGCPVCGRTYEVKDGSVDFGGAPDWTDEGDAVLDAGAVNALTGLHGPGGYLTLVGSVASLWQELSELNPGVALVAINPGVKLTDAPGISALRAGRLPLKSGSMRGVVLGRNYGSQPDWVSEAARAVLPGLRVVGEGPNPSPTVIDLMASADGVWVGTKKR
ncbi:MAG TPA: hypothetical protein VGN76_09000 [Gemmatimonadales bacterium]|jgi:uncharacterized protein YbaR (Trm112 family)|nr:hypothetical protein [Gemmatimonadales bacterium]